MVFCWGHTGLQGRCWQRQYGYIAVSSRGKENVRFVVPKATILGADFSKWLPVIGLHFYIKKCKMPAHYAGSQVIYVKTAFLLYICFFVKFSPTTSPSPSFLFCFFSPLLHCWTSVGSVLMCYFSPSVPITRVSGSLQFSVCSLLNFSLSP